MSSEATTLTGKREAPEEEPGLEEPTYAAKKKRKAVEFPKSFPDPHNYKEPVPHPWERDFDRYSMEIRFKPDWTTKVFNQEILDKWREEIDSAFMFDRLIAELQHLASLKTDEAVPSPVDGVWMVDGVISSDLHNKFTELVRNQLESREKDFHPHSGETVVDLVHPALYCYVHGQSRVCEESNHSQLRDEDQWKSFLVDGTPLVDPTLPQCMDLIERAKEMDGQFELVRDWNGRGRFQPREAPARRTRLRRAAAASPPRVDAALPEPVHEEDEAVRRDPYALRFDVSLLYRAHVPEDQYNTTEEDFVLNCQKRTLSNHITSIYRWIPADLRVNMFGCPEFESYINGLHPWENRELYPVIGRIMQHFLPLWARVLRDLAEGFVHRSNRISDWEFEESAYGLRTEELEQLYQRKLDEGEENPTILNPLEVEMKAPLDFTEASLQVIVKIASIELTPKKPTYTGTWHIEGVPEESIISTGIYYFDEENIEDNFLDFRLALADPYCTSVQNPMGLGGGSTMHREAGSVQTMQGRLLAFPNIMQHCVDGVTLRNKKKPGHRKMLVFFLIDPTKKVLSSSRIPPPRQDWVNQAGVKLATNESVQTLDQAKSNRENLMFTRKFYVISQNENLFERECTFCEH